MNSTAKYREAINAIARDPLLKQRFPRLSTMLAQTVYARLNQLGYVWDAKRQKWALAIPANKNEISVIQFDDNDSPEFVHIRIMCAQHLAEKVTRDLTELMTLVDLEVQRISQPIKNREGVWVRIYIKARRAQP